jgi:hypothetical protein
MLVIVTPDMFSRIREGDYVVLELEKAIAAGIKTVVACLGKVDEDVYPAKGAIKHQRTIIKNLFAKWTAFALHPPLTASLMRMANEVHSSSPCPSPPIPSSSCAIYQSFGPVCGLQSAVGDLALQSTSRSLA